jgi:hypothetical protein
MSSLRTDFDTRSFLPVLRAALSQMFFSTGQISEVDRVGVHAARL